MHPSVRMRHSLVVASLLLAAPIAHAEGRELTEWSSSTLEPKEVRVGLGDIGIGLWGTELAERVEIRLHPIVYTTWAGGIPTYDLAAKFEFWREPRFSLSMAAGITQVNLGRFLNSDDDGDLAFRVIPVEGWGTVRINDRLRATLGGVFTGVQLRARTRETGIDDLGGAVGTSNFEWRASLQYQLSRSWHVMGMGRLLQWEDLSAEAGGQEGDTMGGASASTDLLSFGDAFTVGAAAHYAGPHFNLRLGFEWGNYHVPFVNFIAPQRGLLPVLDLYFRI